VVVSPFDTNPERVSHTRFAATLREKSLVVQPFQGCLSFVAVTQGALASLATLGCAVKPLRGNGLYNRTRVQKLGTTESAFINLQIAIVCCIPIASTGPDAATIPIINGH
jgi:hypothetical protein